MPREVQFYEYNDMATPRSLCCSAVVDTAVVLLLRFCPVELAYQRVGETARRQVASTRLQATVVERKLTFRLLVFVCCVWFHQM